MLNLYWHTIKHLRFQQIFFQVFYRLKKPTIKVSKVVAGHEPLRIKMSWLRPSVSVAVLSDKLQFTALNLTADITEPEVWNSKKFAKLWVYNLHYFDVLRNDSKQDTYKRYVEQWLKNNSRGVNCGWEPYPISIRVVNWIKWFSETATYEQVWLDSLWVQGEHLFKRIEYHILGNHIFANAKALIFLGCFFFGKRSADWLRKGLRILKKQLNEQFLEDGGHFELSPMYHALLLWDLCDLLNLAKQTNNESLSKLVELMQAKLLKGLAWLSSMSHPDGEISFFNDATFAIAPNYKDLIAYAESLQIFTIEQLTKLNAKTNFAVKPLFHSGYYVVDLPNDGRAILDIAKVGADYQPGHAHADTLSFEMSLFQQRFIVNSGISEYGSGPLRLQQRGTKAHSTVNIDSQSSSEVWHGFRVAKRANPKIDKLEESSNEIVLKGSHDGYKSFGPSCEHSRQWKFSKNSLIVSDLVLESKSSNEARFYFHPEVIISEYADGFNCYIGSNVAYLKLQGADSIFIEDGFWYPGFGKKCANKCLVAKFSKRELQTHITW